MTTRPNQRKPLSRCSLHTRTLCTRNLHTRNLCTRNLCTRNLQTRKGATLLDVAVGSMLLSLLLIPSVHLIGESQASNRRLANQDILVYEARQLIEVSKVTFSETTTFNDAMSRGVDVVSTRTVADGPEMTSRVRASADTTLPGTRLLTIQVDLWIDADRDTRMDSTEASHSLRTQWASP